jgi:hypothetical protein
MVMGSTFELPYQQVQDIFADGTIQTGDPCRNVTSQLILSDSGAAAATGCDRGGCRDNIFGIKWALLNKSNFC